jgi:hypothetical protein
LVEFIPPIHHSLRRDVPVIATTLSRSELLVAALQLGQCERRVFNFRYRSAAHYIALR